MDLFDKCKTDGGYFGTARVSKDRYYVMPVLDPIPGRTTIFDGKKLILWSINNYLGLAENEAIKAVAVEAAKKYGVSAPMGSRMHSGNTRQHVDLEKELADFSQKEDAILFNYGYLGVIGTIASLAKDNDHVVIDSLSHASMVDGAFMSRVKMHVFRHNDMDHLEKILKQINRNLKGGILLITEGVFGMTGDLAKLPEICALKEKYGAHLFIDDAHGYGVMGQSGRGTAEHYGVQDEVDVYFGTFAKAFASIGGMTASSYDVIEWIRFNARTQIFAKSTPMIYVQTLKKTLEIIRSKTGDDQRKRLFGHSKKLRYGLINLGFEVSETDSPIVSVYVKEGDLTKGMEMVKFLRENGIFVPLVMYPVIPKGLILFRMIPTPSHTEADIEETVAAFGKMKKEMNLKL
ncbi:MAG: pyridoxal phosphate-dependent aminotransferase family protein [Desulfobacteraceae bacterium]|nr:pyridoxal phosphate-dependent aminotransferase family protein [Desulfobacteraceae bacterium]